MGLSPFVRSGILYTLLGLATTLTSSLLFANSISSPGLSYAIGVLLILAAIAFLVFAFLASRTEERKVIMTLYIIIAFVDVIGAILYFRVKTDLYLTYGYLEALTTYYFMIQSIQLSLGSLWHFLTKFFVGELLEASLYNDIQERIVYAVTNAICGLFTDFILSFCSDDSLSELSFTLSAMSIVCFMFSSILGLGVGFLLTNKAEPETNYDSIPSNNSE